MSIDLVLIQRFEAVHRLGSFSRAADELAITHSAITKSIRSLEDGWNVRLFDRTTRSVVPTEAGRRLALAAVGLLALSEGVKADVIAGDRQLKVICGPAVIDTYIHGALLRFRALCPDVSVHIDTMPPDMACDRLIRRNAHLLLFHAATIDGLQQRKELRVETLVSEPYLVVFRPGHVIAQSDRSLGAMLAFDWTVAGFDSSFQASLPRGLRERMQAQGFPKYRVRNQTACIEMAMRSDVLTLLPATAAAPLVAAGRLDAMPFPGGATLAFGAVTNRTGRPLAMVTAFIDAIRDSHER